MCSPAPQSESRDPQLSLSLFPPLPPPFSGCATPSVLYLPTGTYSLIVNKYSSSPPQQGVVLTNFQLLVDCQ
jgi:hypothetical protein